MLTSLCEVLQVMLQGLFGLWPYGKDKTRTQLDSCIAKCEVSTEGHTEAETNKQTNTSETVVIPSDWSSKKIQGTI